MKNNINYLWNLIDVTFTDSLSSTAGCPVDETSCDASTSLLYSEPIMNLFFASSRPRLMTKMSVESLAVPAGTTINGASMIMSSFTLEVFFSFRAFAYGIKKHHNT